MICFGLYTRQEEEEMLSTQILYTILTCLWLVHCSVVNKGFFWQITDIHYDANYSTTGDPNTMCHQVKSVSGTYNNSMFGNYLCDSPMKLIESAIKAMKSIHPDPDFILWTGDSIPHVDKSVLDLVKVYQNIGNVTEQLRNIFPNTSIYPVLGNHDEYPENAFPAGNTTYYSDVLSECHWSKLLGTEQSEQFKTGGYYRAVTKTNLLILGLNTNIYYGFNPLTKDTLDPVGQLSWLENQLKQAKTNNQKVIIIAHIPPGLFELSSGLMWFYDHFNEKYTSLLTQYASTITAQIYGHEHTDSFRILKDEKDIPVGMMFLSPAVTPWKSTLPGVGSNNPSIRLYEYNQLTGEILDYHQFYLNLAAVSTSNIDKWEKEYDAKADYGLPDMSAASYMEAVKTFKTNPNLFKKYLQFNSVSQNLNPDCQENCQNVHFCSITELKSKNFNDCINKYHSTGHHGPHRHTTTPRPKKIVPHSTIILVCTLAGVVFVLAVIVAILCIKRHSIFIPHQYSRFSSPLAKEPIN